MSLPALATHTVTVVSLSVIIGVTVKHLANAILRLLAGIVVIAAHDDRSRADRALEVLRLLRGDQAVTAKLRSRK
jgi:hypothetical protein